MRLLHVVQVDKPDQTALAGRAGAAWDIGGEAACLVLTGVVADRSVDAEHHVVSLGSSTSESLVCAAGLRGVVRLAPPLGMPSLASVGLSALLKRSGSDGGGGSLASQYDAVVGWGESTKGLLGRLRPVLRDRAWVITMRTGELLHVRGGPGVTLPVPLMRLERVRWGLERAMAREEWRVAENEKVLLALGEGLDAPDAHDLVMMVGTFAVMGRPLTLVVPKHARSLERALRAVHERGYVSRVVVWEGSMLRAIGGADLGVLAPPGILEEPGSTGRLGAGVWASAWGARSVALDEGRSGSPTLIAPMAMRGVLPMEVVGVPSTGPNDLARGVLAALEGSSARTMSGSTDALPAGGSLVRAIEHLAAMRAGSVGTDASLAGTTLRA